MMMNVIATLMSKSYKCITHTEANAKTSS